MANFKDKIGSNEAKLDFPQLNLFMGVPKVGKSTAMAQLPDALILDLEKGRGYRSIDVDALASISSKPELVEAIEYFFNTDDYNNLVVDHLRRFTEFLRDAAKKRHGKSYLHDVGYNKGYQEIDEDLVKFINYLNDKLAKNPDKRVFLVAHAQDKQGAVTLDIDNRNENILLGAVDLIGHITRDLEENTVVSFEQVDNIEAGARNKYLANYEGALDWDKLFKLAKGEK